MMSFAVSLSYDFDFVYYLCLFKQLSNMFGKVEIAVYKILNKD